MYKIDYHTHARFSFDSRTELPELVIAAREKGIDDVICTEHCECNIKPATPPGAPERPTFDHEGYWAYANSVRETTSFDFGIGLEIGQETQDPKRAAAILASHEWDFIIGSLHNIENEYDFSQTNYKEKDPNRMFGDYLEEMYRLAEMNNFCVLGHIYYPLRYIKAQGIDFNYTKYDSDLAEIFRLVIKNGKGIEINISSKGYDGSAKDKEFHLRYAKMFRELGGEMITTGSDGHRPEDVGKNIEDATFILKEAGFKYVPHFRKMKPIFERI